MSTEYPLATSWANFEIHPETPTGGASLADLFPRRDMRAAEEALARRAAEFDLPYEPSGRISNSRLAIEAAEFARDAGRFDEFHRAVFAAYFEGGEDIGDLGVVLGIADETGLDRRALAEHLAVGTYTGRRRETAARAARLGFSGVPAFLFATRYAVVGAQPLEVFRELLEKITAEEPEWSSSDEQQS